MLFVICELAEGCSAQIPVAVYREGCIAGEEEGVEVYSPPPLFAIFLSLVVGTLLGWLVLQPRRKPRREAGTQTRFVTILSGRRRGEVSVQTEVSLDASLNFDFLYSLEQPLYTEGELDNLRITESAVVRSETVGYPPLPPGL